MYRGRDTRLDRDVAIKILPEAFAADAERVARFQREAKTLASLSHPNIGGIYGLEERDGITALVMELVEGEDLSQRIARGAIPIDEALPVARQIAEALEAAHEQGIVHRDLKPANIKVRPDGMVRVLDFGLAKAMDPVGSAPDVSQSPTITTPAMMTGAGMILGTAAYMSPEQARGKMADKRADIWAFGVVVFEMLSGQRLFTGETISDTLAAVIKSDPKWSLLPAGTPPAVRRLLERCLEKDPKQRLQAIGEARIVLAGPLEDERGAVAVSSRSRLGPLPWAVAAGTFLLITLGVSFVHFRETPSSPKGIRFQVSAPEDGAFGPFRLSPDGRHLAFVTRGAGQNRLWVRSLDSVHAVPLAGTDGATYPFWSPDSTRIGFFAQGKLKTITASGGLAVSLCDAVNGRGGAWNRDGVILFTPTLTGGIYRVADTGGTPGPVTAVTGPNGSDRFPEFLPDGLRFLFLRALDKDGGIYAGSLSGASVTRLLPDISNAAYAPGMGHDGFLLFRRNNTLMAQSFDPNKLATTGGVMPIAEQVGLAASVGYGAFASSQDGTLAYLSGIQGGSRQLVWLDRSGNRLGVVSKPDEINSQALSPDGGMVAFSVGDPATGVGDLWLQYLEGGGLSRLTFGPRANGTPVWSPDGSQLVHASSLLPGDFKIQQLPIAGAGHPEVVVEGSSYNTAVVYDWSADGRLIVFGNRSEKTKDDLWLLPTEGDRKAVPFLQTPANERHGQFSPDGEWMAYQSDESGRYETYVQRVPLNGSKFQMSSAGGEFPRWSRNGKELFYLEGGQKLMSVPVKLGKTFERGQGRLVFEHVRFFVGSSFGFPFQPSADGQRFLALLRTEGDSQAASITVVTNWQTTLRK